MLSRFWIWHSLRRLCFDASYVKWFWCSACLAVCCMIDMKRGVVDIPFWITIVCFASLRMCKWLFLLVITYGKDWSFEVQHPLKHLAMNTDVCRFWTSQSRGYKIPSLTSYNPSFSAPPSQEGFQKPNRHGECPLPENRLRSMYVCGRLAFDTKTIWTGLAIAKSLHFTSSTSFPKKTKNLSHVLSSSTKARHFAAFLRIKSWQRNIHGTKSDRSLSMTRKSELYLY